MMVVLILSMLLAIVVPYYVKQRATAQANICVNNLLKIENAACEFALETGKKTGDPINYPADLKPFLKLNQGSEIPPCPAGGIYALNLVGTNPICSLGSLVNPPHILP